MQLSAKKTKPFSAINLMVLVACVIIMFSSCRETHPTNRIDIAQALSDGALSDCFKRAIEPAQIQFPGDAGPHPDFKTEWWYYTGNLISEKGRHFGYQLTFFRQALSCDAVTGQSKWRTRQLYFAHFAVTDTRARIFHADSRMNRESLGIAGARALPFKVWIDDWQVIEKEGHLALTAWQKDISLSLILTQKKPVLRQGENGRSQKGPDPANGSYYYSLPRLLTTGTISIKDTTHRVKGNTWFDHEWSTSALNKDVAGWDWFSVHLEDGRDIMVCQIRKSDGTVNDHSFGSISFKDGKYTILDSKGFTITTEKNWKSPETGISYPSKWQITLLEHDLVLRVVPMIPNQEHTHSFVYWEGAAEFKSSAENDTVKGLGYVELTGY